MESRAQATARLGWWDGHPRCLQIHLPGQAKWFLKKWAMTINLGCRPLRHTEGVMRWKTSSSRHKKSCEVHASDWHSSKEKLKAYINSQELTGGTKCIFSVCEFLTLNTFSQQQNGGVVSSKPQPSSRNITKAAETWNKWRFTNHQEKVKSRNRQLKYSRKALWHS